MSKKKYYAVKKGRTVGIFDNWDDCKLSIDGFTGAIYKSFTDREDANDFLNNSNNNNQSSTNTLTNEQIKSMVNDDLSQNITAVFVDGSFNKQIKKYSYGVYILTNEENKIKEYKISRSLDNEKYLEFNNVSGEVFGVINALDWCISNKKQNIKIYYDYQGLESWINGSWKPTTSISKLYVDLYKEKKLFFDSINFQKVYAHSKIEYNDKADELAKEALNGKNEISKIGDSYYVIKNFDKLSSLIKEIENQKFIEISKYDDGDDGELESYKLKMSKEKLSIRYFVTKKTLTIQGKISTLFIHILDILSTILDDDKFSSVLKAIAKGKVHNVNEFKKAFPKDYPKDILNLLKSSKTLLEIKFNNSELEDYSFLLMQPLKALEGHLKWILKINKIGIDGKNRISCFNENKITNMYEIPEKICKRNQIEPKTKQNLEDCYNFFSKYRHSSFHFQYSDEYNSSDNIIESQEYAKQIANECIELIKSTLN